MILHFRQPIAYEVGERLQAELVERRIEERIPDIALLLQHQPVITLGRRGRRGYLLVGETELETRGIQLVHASRGGDVTYHAPGQLILYPIHKLRTGSHRLLDQLESLAIETARSSGVRAFRREGKAGAWTEEGKIAAIGLAFKRWVSYHGMSLNVDLDLNGFNLIVGCGLEGETVASLTSILGTSPTVEKVSSTLLHHFERLFSQPQQEVLHDTQAAEWLRRQNICTNGLTSPDTGVTDMTK